VHGYDTKQKLSFSLGKYTTVFWAEVYAIKAWSVENQQGGNRNTNTYILLDSQAAIKALNNYQINSKLV
jgi:hypothetical protein